MFTGITEELGQVGAASPKELTIKAATVLEDCRIGDSIAVNGVCLTVIRFDKTGFTVGVMPETWRLTTLGKLNTGDPVNLERALTFHGRIGGHLVQGHVDGVGEIIDIKSRGEEYVVRITAPAAILKYIVMKGFIAVDGMSLTVSAKTDRFFEVSLIQHTRQVTTFTRRRAGDKVNLETDIIARYVEALWGTDKKSVNADFLREHGFLVQ